MAFWGIELKPGKPYVIVPDGSRRRLHLSQATLGLEDMDYERNTVQCKVGGKDPVFLCALRFGTMESFAMNLVFEEDEDVEFSVLGQYSVHLTGFYQHLPDNYVDYEGGNDSREEEEEEKEEEEEEERTEESVGINDDRDKSDADSASEDPIEVKRIRNEKWKKNKNEAGESDNISGVKGKNEKKKKNKTIESDIRSEVIRSEVQGKNEKTKKKKNKSSERGSAAISALVEHSEDDTEAEVTPSRLLSTGLSKRVPVDPWVQTTLEQILETIRAVSASQSKLYTEFRLTRLNFRREIEQNRSNITRKRSQDEDSGWNESED